VVADVKWVMKLRFLIVGILQLLDTEEPPIEPQIESWEIQKSKLSRELFGYEHFETSILRFLKLKKMFTGQALIL
jgi:hypothetical protein